MDAWIVNPYTAGDGFKLCPQILWYSSLHEVEFNSPALESGGHSDSPPVNSIYWAWWYINFVKGKATSAWLSWVSHPGGRQHDGARTHQQPMEGPCGRELSLPVNGHVSELSWIPQLQSSLQIIAAPADILTVMSRGTQNQKGLTKPFFELADT